MLKKIVFEDPHNRTKRICETTVLIEEKTYSCGKNVYIINYEHIYVIDGERSKCLTPDNVIIPNPFAETPFLKEHFDGEIIIKNEMTQSMIKYLLMEDKDLEKFIGNADTNYYRSKIMINIHNLWD